MNQLKNLINDENKTKMIGLLTILIVIWFVLYLIPELFNTLFNTILGNLILITISLEERNGKVEMMIMMVMKLRENQMIFVIFNQLL